MSKRRANAEVMVPITADDIERFHRCAPAALERRGGGFVFEELGTAFRLFLMGMTPIVGMLYFGWSANQLLLFLLVGAWVSIVCDIAKLALLRNAVKAFAQPRIDDSHVWVVAEALRKGKNEAPRDHLRQKYQPELGALVDVLFGTVSSAVIWVSAAGADPDFGIGLLEARGVVYGLACLVAYQVLFTVWEIVDHKTGSGADRGVKVAVGLRGVGLFLLMFLVIFVEGAAGENGQLARAVMLTANGTIVFVGLLSVAGIWMMRGETAWLRDYLRRRG